MKKWLPELKWWKLALEQSWERVIIWVAWHLPRRVAYWAFIRVGVHDYNLDPGGRTLAHALNHWASEGESEAHYPSEWYEGW